ESQGSPKSASIRPTWSTKAEGKVVLVGTPPQQAEADPLELTAFVRSQGGNTSGRAAGPGWGQIRPFRHANSGLRRPRSGYGIRGTGYLFCSSLDMGHRFCPY